MAKGIELTLKEGDKAPAFKAESQDGETIRLSDFKGKFVVLYFYPKDNTPGCTKEACAFRDLHSEFESANAVVLGVSTDPVKAHQKFVNKFELPFTLLADDSKEIVSKYGVWGPKQFMGRTFDGTHRITFLIDPKGKIIKIWPKVKPEPHPSEVLEFIQETSLT
ncbi:thioredoxin-dependent thiol peroxidase [bacterium]|nr:thioredoxin-dependent thiol peroxidase [bacterium]